MPILIGGIAGLVISLLIGASLLGIVGYVMAGAAAGALGAAKTGAVETFYWIMLLVLVVLLALKFFGLPIPGFVVFLPVMMMLSRLIALWTTGLVARFQN